MTVAEIKEYIEQSIDIHFGMGEDKREKQLHRCFAGELRIICDKLDELEPNTISQAIKVIDKEKDKLKFDTDKHQVDSCIFEIRNILGLGAKENNNGNKNAH